MRDLTLPKGSPQVLKDIWKAILNDAWMNIVIWGEPRTGKTTCQMDLAYWVYKDWDMVLRSFVYNLAGILYNMEHGVPTRILTLNKLHDRVPIIMPDDWGAHGNKAKTQHEPAMDIFKGAIDTYGTQIAIFLSSMGSPDSLTQQLQAKYTHEIYVGSRGEAKYDKIEWQQNFGGWQPRRKKAWIESFDFDPVPMDVYREYDERRISLVQQLNQLIKDAMVDGESYRLLRRLGDKDIAFLKFLREKAPVTRDHVLKEDMGEIAKRCVARSLVISFKKPNMTTYYFDITDFGLDILQLIDAKELGE